MVGRQPHKKKGWNQRAGHDPQGMHAGVANELAPFCPVRKRASDAANSFRAEKIHNEFQWLKAFKNEKKKENNAESEECMDVEERHRGIERKFHPERQRSPSLKPVGRRSGVSDPGYRGSAKECFAPMPQQKNAGGNRVKQSALSHKHG